MPSSKAELRARVRAARRARQADSAAGQKGRVGRDLVSVARTVPLLAALAGRGVGCYLPLPGEPDVTELRDWLGALGARVWLPVVTEQDGAPALVWAVDDGAFAPGAALPSGVRIPEPTGPTVTDPGPLAVVLLPALAVDTAGWRLGQGAGYYDRTIARLGWGAKGGNGPVLVAVVHDDEVLPAVPHDEHDRPADAILTPTRWIDCRAEQ